MTSANWTEIRSRGSGSDVPLDSTFLADGEGFYPDGSLDLTDVIALLAYLYLGGVPGPCEDAGDSDDSGDLDITDFVYLLNYQFLAGPEPPPPFHAKGPDPTPDSLGCKG